MKIVELQPIREVSEDYEAIERELIASFRSFYQSLVKEIGESEAILKNSRDILIRAIESGRIQFHQGRFKGRLDSSLTRELRKLGAKWDRKQGCYKVPLSSLPVSVRSAIKRSESKFQKVLEKIDKRLAEFSPDELFDKLKLADYFDTTLFRAEKTFEKSLKGITVPPKMTPERRRRIAEEYEHNMKLDIKGWTKDEVEKLRAKIKRDALSGLRYENFISKIQKSYSVSYNKAKFLARQETSLLMAKYREVRYQEAGVREYKWTCVAGSPHHPVRPMHKRLDGKIFRWDQPPVVNDKGERKNPGEDYNCRCFARPIVRFS